MVDWLGNLQVFVAIVVLGGGLVLTGVSAVSYVRIRNPRALLVGLGFLGMTAKGVLLTIEAISTGGRSTWALPVGLVDLWILAAFYVAMRKR